MNFIKNLISSSRLRNNTYSIAKNCIHHITNTNANNSSTSFMNSTPKNTLLIPKVVTIIPNCGLKYFSRLKRRCKDCYFVFRKDRLYVMCKTHPRHKQGVIKPNPDKSWILTHATQGPRRPW